MSFVATLRPFVFRHHGRAAYPVRASGEATAKTIAQMFAPGFPLHSGRA